VRITDVAKRTKGQLDLVGRRTAHQHRHLSRPQFPGRPVAATPDQLIDPGDVNTPAVVEPAQAGVVDTSTVLIAASGGPNWGGADVWLSFDGTSYSNFGKINNPPSRAC
jgi:hypothetical protein